MGVALRSFPASCSCPAQNSVPPSEASSTHPLGAAGVLWVTLETLCQCHRLQGAHANGRPRA